jgi:hypothetical protein
MQTISTVALWNNDCAQNGGSAFWREKSIVRLGAWSIRCLQWPGSIYGDMARAEVGEFILLVLHGGVQNCGQGRESLFSTGCTAPTYHQPIMSMWSYSESFVLLKHLGCAWQCGTELGSAIASLRSLRPHFRIEHKWSTHCLVSKSELKKNVGRLFC